MLPLAEHKKVLENPVFVMVGVSDPAASNVCVVDLCKRIIYPDCDIKFTGNVSWVGKTSMEVKMHMLQVSSCDFSPSHHRDEVLRRNSG